MKFYLYSLLCMSPYFSPALLALSSIILSLLALSHYLSIPAAGILLFMVFCTLFYRGYASLTMICLSLLLSSIAAYRFALKAHRIPHIKHQQQLRHVYARVIDKEPSCKRPLHDQTTIRFHSQMDHAPYTYRIYIPASWDIQVDDTVYIPRLYIPEIRNVHFMWFLMREGIDGYVHGRIYMQCIDRPFYSLSRWLSHQRSNLLNMMYTHVSRERANIVSQIFLGYRAMSVESKQQYQSWGIMHMLARSGLHLMIFVFLCTFVFRYVPMHYLYRDALTLSLTSIYLLISWPSVSFLRAFWMLVGYYLSRALRIRYHAHHWVVFIAVILLSYNPMHLFFIDFQLSFLLTYTLCLMHQQGILVESAY